MEHSSEMLKIFSYFWNTKTHTFFIPFSVPMRNSDGYYMLDDMLLDENQIKLFYGTDEERSGAAKIGYWVKRWPNGVIPYSYSSQIPHQDREAIEASLSIFNEEFKGCLSTRYFSFKF